MRRAGLCAALVALVALVAVPVARADVRVLSGQTSCVTTFSGTWSSSFQECTVPGSYSVPAGTTLQISVAAGFSTTTNAGTIVVSGNAFVTTGTFSNLSGGLLEVQGDSTLRVYGSSATNHGMIRGSFEHARPFTNASDGTVWITRDLLIADSLTNDGSITVTCGATITSIFGDTITGNPAAISDCAPPAVTLGRAAGQAAATNAGSVSFTATFSEAVTGLDVADVVLGGTADHTGSVTQISGGPSVYTIAVTGLAGEGTVSATLPAAVAADLTGDASAASTGADDSVTIDRVAPDVQISGPAAGGTYTVGSVPVATCTTTDATSDVAVHATAAMTGAGGDGTGTVTATCSGGSDAAGNVAAPVSRTFSVVAAPVTTPPAPAATPPAVTVSAPPVAAGDRPIRVVCATSSGLMSRCTATLSAAGRTLAAGTSAADAASLTPTLTLDAAARARVARTGWLLATLTVTATHGGDTTPTVETSTVLLTPRAAIGTRMGAPINRHLADALRTARQITCTGHHRRGQPRGPARERAARVCARIATAKGTRIRVDAEPTSGATAVVTVDYTL